MSQKNGDEMPQDNRRYRQIPDELSGDDPDVHFVVCRAEQVPAPAERIGDERDDELARQQEVGKIVGNVIGDRNRHQCQDKIAGDVAKFGRTAHSPHQGAKKQKSQREGQRKDDQARRLDQLMEVDAGLLQRDQKWTQGRILGDPLQDARPDRCFQESVIRNRREDQ